MEADMALYGGIDLHSNNSVIVLLDEQDQEVFRTRSKNELDVILKYIRPYQSDIKGLAVESTFNWYWLVDGLQEAGYQVHLVNTAAVKQYDGLKHSDDNSDARWLAHLLRLGILPEGYIYPKEDRAIRDLLRKRAQLVHDKTRHVLSVQNLYARNRGEKISGNLVFKLSKEDILLDMEDPFLALAANSNRELIQCLKFEINKLEKVILQHLRLCPDFNNLKTLPGVGKILSMTILLETGNISRFAKAGNYASYCRCVGSQRISNGKKKGVGNRKNGNKYLAWAFVEAANFAVRYYPYVRSFYQRKQARTNGIVAIKTIAHKLARASYYILRDKVPYEATKAFG